MKLLGGHTALDFVNTVGGRTHSTAAKYVVDRDHLQTVDDLFAWAKEAGILARSPQRRGSAALLQRALRLRESLYRIFRTVAAARKPDARDLDVLNRELAKARAHERLSAARGHVTIEWNDRDSPEHLLRVIARAAAELLTSEQVSRVRQCGGESCGWLFLDTSRNRSRQWCDMGDCGNLAKVRRFRERNKGETAT